MTTSSSPSSPVWDSITLNHDDQAAMPASLRTALQSWHRQHRALESGVSFQEALEVPERVTMDQLTRATLQAVHGILDLKHFTPWVERLHLERDQLRAANERTALFEVVIEARRLDLLDALLAHPDLRPITKEFNGGLYHGQRRAVDPSQPGVAFLTALTGQWTSFQWHKHPIVAAFPNLDQDRQMAAMELEAARNRQNQRVGVGPMNVVYQGAQTPTPAMLQRLEHAHGARDVAKLNLVGLAVMHGWPDGVQRLLDAGVNPYALVSTRRLCHSALALASVFDEPACAAVLVRHPSFSLTARYGEADRDIAKRGLPVSPFTLWRQIDPSLQGGFDWNLLCRSSAMDDPTVQAAMLERWNATTANHQARLTLHDPMAARRWEQALLRATLDGTAPTPHPGTRARL